MRKMKGFTLIELLIVVAIIAILAAIAVPNFLEAQVRSKVSRVKTDMRSLATAIEAYMVDNNMYAGCMLYPPAALPGSFPTGRGEGPLVTFTTRGTSAAMTLTTPVSYITSLPRDAFGKVKGAPFAYVNADEMGWILWSMGPDTEDDIYPAAQMFTTSFNPAQSIYNPGISNPSLWLMTLYTYDSTNGTTSNGDVHRVKQ